MDTPPTVYLRHRGHAAGPFTLEQLRELAAGGTIGPDTEAAESTASPWGRLGALPLGAKVFATERFKPREFEQSEGKAGTAVELRDIIAAAHVKGKATGEAPAPVKPAPAEHDVAALLQFNHELEKRRGLFSVKPVVPKKSRRKRDYWLLLGGVGVLIFAVLIGEAVIAVALQTLAARMPEQFWPILWQVLFHSPVLAFGAGMFAFYAAALTWLMFGLMEDY